MRFVEMLTRFAQKPLRDQWAAIRATFGVSARASEWRRLHRLLTGAHVPPRVLRSNQKTYLAFRPDSDIEYKHHPEAARLAESWTKNNILNCGDLPRLYSLIFNIKQVLGDNIVGDMAELGVYRGNSAALLAHYAKLYQRTLFLFDTFHGFDQRDLVGLDETKLPYFNDTSLDMVRNLTGDKNIKFVRGRFPDSVTKDLSVHQFCLVHIDCDLYEPAKEGLDFFYPRLSPGGLLIIHDYANPYWVGIKRAVDEYCSNIPERPIVFADKAGTAMIRKSMLNSA